jgi:ribonuclease P/MRP protein subunit RPP1
MYEAVTPHPEGRSTPARFASVASRYGFDGVVVLARGGAPPSDPSVTAVREHAGIDVVDGVEIVADDPGSAGGSVGNYRSKRTLVCVRGGTDALNRFAVEQDRVDVLTRPFADDGDVNHVVVRAAREHGVRVEFDLGPVLRASGGARVRHLRKLRTLAALVDHYDAPFVASATPPSHLGLRAPRELRAVGEAVGLGAERVTAGLREWGRLAERNRRRLDDSFISPGVERGRYEEER